MKSILLSLILFATTFSTFAQSSIGAQHNALLHEAFKSVDLKSPTVDKELKAFFLNYSSKHLSEDQFEQIEKLSVKQMRTEFSKAAQTHIQGFEAIINNLSNYASLEKDLNELSLVIRRDMKINKKDRMMLNQLIDVGLHSAYFWLPKSKGGEGMIYILDQAENLALREWGAIIFADCWGALGGLVMGGGPIGAVISGAWASAGAYLYGVLSDVFGNE